MKKNLIIITLVAILLIGSVALNAVTYQVIVHVSGSGVGGYQVTGSWPVENVVWNSGSNPLPDIEGPLGASFACWGTNPTTLVSDEDSGTLDPYEINHFYLNLNGVLQPDPEPIED